MLLQFVVTQGPEVGRVYPLTPGVELSVGRGPRCAIRLNDGSVSKVHCELQVAEDRVTVADAKSTWGTLVNGVKITQQELGPGDVLTLGQSELTLRAVSTPDATTVDLKRRPESEKPPPAGRARSRPSRTVPRATQKASTPKIPRVADLNDLVGMKFLRYEIQKVIARARTGMVFRASDTTKNHPVALKVLWPELACQETQSRRFLRAIKTMLPIRHENLVALYGAGRTSGYCFMALEFVDGESVAKSIQRIGIGGMLDWQHAWRVARDVARALEVAHEHSIVHRNITPQNILIRTSDGMAKLGDLMLAKAMEGTFAEEITQRGELVGEVAYLAPEQTTGSRQADCRSDIYSLGATLYALLTGRPPFSGRTPVETIEQIQTEPAEKPTKYHLGIPSRFEDVVMRMLAKRPEDRFETPTRLLRELDRVATFQEIA